MLAERLEATRCSTWIMPYSDEHDYGPNFDLHVERLEKVARVLGEHGVRLGLEFVGPKTTRAGKKFEFVHDMPGMFELIGSMQVPGVGLLLDSFHWFTSGGTVEDLESVTSAEIIDVHLNDAVPGRSADQQLDNERLLPGESGVIDLNGFLSALHKMGYDGPAGAEPFSLRVKSLPPAQAAAETAGAVRKVWAAAGLPWVGPKD
jgi:sugar phosphate isomerase/epimerase